MHVLLVPSWYPTSASDVSGSFFREQALALTRAGCRVGVIAPHLESLRRWRLIRRRIGAIQVTDDCGVATLRVSTMNWFPKMPVLRYALWSHLGKRLYAEYVKHNGKPDIIHAHSLLLGGCLARELAQSECIPYVVTEHSTAFAQGQVSPIAHRMATVAATSASQRFAVSEPFSSMLAGAMGMSPHAWRYLPNMVDPRFLQQPLAKTPAPDVFRFLHVSLLDRKKAVDILLRAFTLAFRGRPNVELCIGGDGGTRGELESLAATLGIADQVRFLGRLSREEVAAEMLACDAFALSSRYETFGVVLIEAMALGKPIVATQCGGPESIVTPVNGRLVPVDDIAAMAHAMAHIVEHRADYDPESIRRDCVARFSEARVTADLMACYEATVCSYASATRATS